VAQSGAEQALSFVLSWYQGIDLYQLERLRKDGLSNVDPAQLRRCACTIAECTNTDKLFNTGEGEGNEDMGDLGIEVSGFTGSPMHTPEDPARELDPAPHRPSLPTSC
jgi:hypothetical protein